MKCCTTLVAAVALASAGVGCGQGKGETSGDDAAAADVAADVPPLVLPLECDGAPTPPKTLICTGLYADIASKTLAPGVVAYAPAVPLWSDGAEKERWIQLPSGSVIDNSDANEWTFPVGTKAWKQFTRDGRRVETRLWQKVRSNYWVNATYAWNDDESAAPKSAGGDISVGPAGATYHIPTDEECEKCHRGRTDRLLGFDQVQLGLAGASGFTLERLVAERRLTSPPAATTLVIGDDGTGQAAPALGWLHANCGSTCHNRNSNAMAYGSMQFLRLDATQLDGRPVNDFDALTTTMGVVVRAPAWSGQVRIVPGDPTKSLLYHLISNRGMGNQMPPIASRLVDVDRIPLVHDWIAAMPSPPPPPDAGAPDATEPVDAVAPPPPDAGVDAEEPADVGVDVEEPADAGAPPDAGVDGEDPDAAVPDPTDAGV